MNRTWLSAIGFLACVVPAMAQGGPASLHIFYIGTVSGTPHVWQSWEAYGAQSINNQDVTSAANAPVPASSTSPLAAFADAVGEHVFYPSSNQHLYQLYYCDHNCVPLNTWISQDITAMAGGPLLASGTTLSGFVSGTQEHVAYLGTNQHVYQFVTTSNGTWTYQDLTATTGGTVAASGSALASFNDSSGQHVFYLGANGHVYQLYYAYNTRTWADQDLTAQTGGALAASGSALSSLVDSQEHVFYEGTNQHIYQLLTHPGGWLNQDVTAQTYWQGATLLVAIPGSAISSFADSHGDHVYFLSTATEGNPQYPWPLFEFFSQDAGSDWVAQIIDMYPLLGSALTSFGSGWGYGGSGEYQNVAFVVGPANPPPPSINTMFGFATTEYINPPQGILSGGGSLGSPSSAPPVSPTPLAGFVR